MKGCSFLPVYLVVLSLFFQSCRKSETEDLTTDFGYQYFPLETGLEYIYRVDSIVFREGVDRVLADTNRIFFRELITDSLPDRTFRIERYESLTAEGPWRIAKVFTAARTDRQAFRIEDNLRFVKLIFPLREGVQWDGNRFLPGIINFEGSSRDVNIFKEWNYRVSAVEVPETVAGQSYPAVTTIQQADFETNIDLRRAVEKYAKNVGLVSREWFILDTQCQFCCNGDIGETCRSTPWDERAETGFILRQELLSFQNIN